MTPDAREAVIQRLLDEAASHERFYPSDTLHGLLREAASELSRLRAVERAAREANAMLVGILSVMLEWRGRGRPPGGPQVRSAPHA